ncbi:hypothetical protein LEN26_014575 [Aphanomyces euteiches]|nr:hypothetical protein LEN26_014575 [Aphanomyces euteiches]
MSLGCIVNYRKVVVPSKTVAELDADEWLWSFSVDPSTFISFKMIHFNRWWLLLFTFLANLTAGSVLAFTALYDALDVYFYGSPTKSSVTVMLQAYIWMGISAAFSGPYIERQGPRMGMTIGTVLTAIGFVLSQLAVGAQSPIFLNVGYGAFCGSGFGFVLIATMSTVQKWFPDLRGVVSGLIMFAFGLGNALFTVIYTKGLNRAGAYAPVTDVTNVPKIFWMTGVAIVIILALTTLVIRTPPVTFTANGHDMHGIPVSTAPDPQVVNDEYLKIGMTFVNYSVVQSELEGTDRSYFQHVKALSLLQCIASTDFLCLYIAFAANIIPALMFSTELRDISIGVFGESVEVTNAVLTQGLISTSLGRLCVPLVSDLMIRIFYTNPAFSRKAVFAALLTYQLVFLAVVPKASMTFGTFRWLGLSFVFASGGGLALIQCFITDLFGVYHAGTMYGLNMTCWSLRAVVVGYAFTSFKVTHDSFTDQLQWMLALIILGWVAMLFVRTNSMDRFFYGYQYSLCGKVIFQWAFLRVPSDTYDVEEESVTILAPPHASALSEDGFILWQSDSAKSLAPLNLAT